MNRNPVRKFHFERWGTDGRVMLSAAAAAAAAAAEEEEEEEEDVDMRWTLATGHSVTLLMLAE
jgi:hypothetical protein